MDEDMRFVCKVSVDNADAINTAIQNNFQNVGPETFSAPYSSDGSEPATHKLCSWSLSTAAKNAVVNYLTNNYPGLFEQNYVTPDGVQAVISGWGLVSTASV